MAPSTLETATDHDDPLLLLADACLGKPVQSIRICQMECMEFEVLKRTLAKNGNHFLPTLTVCQVE